MQFFLLKFLSTSRVLEKNSPNPDKKKYLSWPHCACGETLETHLLQQVSEKETDLFWELGCEVAMAG